MFYGGPYFLHFSVAASKSPDFKQYSIDSRVGGGASKGFVNLVDRNSGPEQALLGGFANGSLEPDRKDCATADLRCAAHQYSIQPPYKQGKKK
jgi:hypothetical protein